MLFVYRVYVSSIRCDSLATRPVQKAIPFLCPSKVHLKTAHSLDQPVQVSEPNHHSYQCSVQIMPNQVMSNNVDMTNEVTNSNDEEVAIPPGYYSIGDIIAILNTITDITFSIYTIASSYGCIWIQSPYSIHFSNSPDIREIPGLNGRRLFYLLRSVNRICLISRAIAKWFKCIHRWSDPPIWSFPARIVCSPQWSLTIPRLTTIDL